MSAAKVIIASVLLLLFMTLLPDVVSSDTMFLGMAIILGGGVAYSGKEQA